MRLNPRIAALALALTAFAVVPAGIAHGEGSVYCFTQPAVGVKGNDVASAQKLCIPWPFSL